MSGLSSHSSKQVSPSSSTYYSNSANHTIPKHTSRILAGRRHDKRDVFVKAHRDTLIGILRQKEPFLFQASDHSNEQLLLPIAKTPPITGIVDIVILLAKEKNNLFGQKWFEVTVSKRDYPKLYNYFHQGPNITSLSNQLNQSQLMEIITECHMSPDPGKVIGALNKFWLAHLEKISKVVARNVYTFNYIEKQAPYIENQHTYFITSLMKQIFPKQIGQPGDVHLLSKPQISDKFCNQNLSLSQSLKIKRGMNSGTLEHSKSMAEIQELSNTIHIGGSSSDERTASTKLKSSPLMTRIVPQAFQGRRSLKRNPSTLSRDQFGEVADEESSSERDSSIGAQEENKVINIEIQDEKVLPQANNRPIDIAVNGLLFEFFRDDASLSAKEQHFSRGLNRAGNVVYICYNKDSGRFSSVCLQMKQMRDIHVLKEPPPPKPLKPAGVELNESLISEK